MSTAYQSRPVAVTAWQFLGDREVDPDFRRLGVSYWEAGLVDDPRPYLHIPSTCTSDGQTHYAFPGEWLVLRGHHVFALSLTSFTSSYEPSSVPSSQSVNPGAGSPLHGDTK